ncbi:hypothetical protein BJ170DRAFT_345341 [Xylariales sp. AK1849]|nr:hypothetical protein BJ170DRAFT_345341 [Xylariales sp. AK1849]
MEKKHGAEIIRTPVWVLVVRIFQFILSLIVVGAAAWFIHGYYMPSLGFAIVCALFTWIIFFYAVLSEKVSACHGVYNTWAVLSLDALMIVFWLSAMGAVANARASFKYSATVTGCENDGSAVNSNYCTVEKRMLEKRAGVASEGALDVVSGIAGICAIIMLLFVATFAYVCHEFRLSSASRSSDPEKPMVIPTAVEYNPNIPNHQGTEMTSNIPGQQAQPLLAQQQTYQHQQQQPQPKWAEQVYAQHTGYSHQGAPVPQYTQSQPYDPYMQQSTGYAGGGGVYSPEQVGQPQRVPYSPHGTPAPGQQFHQLPTHQ